MKIKTFFVVSVSALTLLTSGCIPTPDGRGAVGVKIASDTIHSRYDRTVAQLNDATRQVLKRNGKIQMDDVANNSFKARINEHNVWVKITKVDEKNSEVLVQARGTTTGDIELAAEIDKQIALQLTVGQ